MSDRRYKIGLWLGRLVAVIPPLILLICIGIYFVALKNAVLASLPQIVASALGVTLKREIRIGGIVATHSFDHITLTDVAVSDAPTFAQGGGRAMVTAERVDIRLNVDSLFHDFKDAGSYISLITLTRPVGYVERLPGNKFNFSSLLPKPHVSTGRRPFSARIVVVDGTATIRDRMAPAALQPAVNTVRHVNGVLDFGAAHLVAFNVVAVGTGGRFSTAQVFGNIASAPNHDKRFGHISGYDIHVDAQQADAAYFTQYFLQKVTATLGRVTAGRADVSVTLSEVNPVPHKPLDITGTARVADAQILVRNTQILRAPVEGIFGSAYFTGNSLALNASASVSGMPVKVAGAVPSFKNPAFALRFEAPSVDMSRLHSVLPFAPALPRWLSVTSRPSVVATMAGPLKLLRFAVAFNAAEGAVYGTRVTDITGGLGYVGHALTIDNLVASTAGQRDNIQLSGVIGAGHGSRTELHVHAVNVDLSDLSLPEAVRAKIGAVSGIADADAVFASDSPPQADAPIPVSVTARVRNGAIHGVPIQGAAIDFSTNWRSASITQLVALQPGGGMVSATGNMPLNVSSRQPYDLNVRVAGADLGELAPHFGLSKLSGVAYFHGDITGRAALPELAGKAIVFGGGFGKYQADQIEAGVQLSPRLLVLKGGTLRRLGVTIAFSGSASDPGKPDARLAAEVSTHNAEISDITSILEQILPPVKTSMGANLEQSAAGSLDATVHVEGPLKQPEILASAAIDSATVGGVELSNVQATASYDAAILKVETLHGTVDGADLIGSGTFNTSSKAIDAAAQVESADLSRIATAFGITQPVSGTASFTANVGGVLDNPQVSLNGSVQDLKYRDIQVDLQKVRLLYANGVVTNDQQPILVTTGPATYSLSSLRYDSRRKSLSLSATVEGEQIARLIEIARDLAPTLPSNIQLSDMLSRLPPGFDGALNVSRLDLSGPLNDPSVHAVATITGLTMGTRATGGALDIAADVSYAHGLYTVASLDGHGGSKYLAASGAFDAAGELKARLEASNIPLSLFQPFLPNIPSLGGEISDVTLIASGTASKPELAGSLSLLNVAVKGVAIDRIDSGRITIANNEINLAGVTFDKTEQATAGRNIQHTGIIRGSIPFVFSLHNGYTAYFPADQPISLTAQLPEQSVSLLALFAPSLRTLKMSGTLAASLNIGGTLANKVITGSVQLNNGSFQPAGFSTAFSDINLAANFDGTKGTITSSKIESSKGGDLTLAGTIAELPTATSPTQFASAAEALLGDLRMNLTAEATNFTIDEPKIGALYNAGFAGVINGKVVMTEGLLKPHLAGALHITKAVGTLPTLPALEAAFQPEPVFNPSFDLAVDVAQGSSVKSSELNAQVNGTASIRGTLYRPNITADLNLPRGTFKFPTAIFRIQPTGTVHFVYNPPEQAIDRVDIVASTTLSISNTVLAANPVGYSDVGGETYTQRTAALYSNPNSSSQSYQITVMITGDLATQNGLHLDFQSDPSGLTTSQILGALGGEQLLSGGNVTTAASAVFQQVLLGSVVPSLLEPLEEGIANTFGLEEFNINYDMDSPLQVSILKKLGKRLDLRYTRFVDSRSGGAVGATLQPLVYMVAVDYYLTNRFRIDLSTDDQEDNAISLDDVINF